MRFDSDILTYEGGVEIEKQVKLLESISSIKGDFSYSFSIPNTARNRGLLGIRSLNSTAYWNKKIQTEILNNSGVAIYRGYLQIDGQDENEIRLSFYSGNTDWFTDLNVNLHDLNYAKLDNFWTGANIVTSWASSSGIVFPFVNRGSLLERKSPSYYTDDFQPFLYVKDAIRVIMANTGIKLQGDLFDDPLYNSLITSNNSSKGSERRSVQQESKAGKTSNQAISTTTETKVTFTSVDDPYYNSPSGNWSVANSVYTFSEDVRVYRVSTNIRINNTSGSYLLYVRIYLNTTLVHENRAFYQSATNVKFELNSNAFILEPKRVNTYDGTAEAGDTLEVRVYYTTSGTLNVGANSYFHVKPIKFTRVDGAQCLPDKKASEFVKDVFSLFNVIVSYDGNSKTLTVKKLDNVLRTDPIDISQYVERDSIEYLDFIQGYAQDNRLVYQDQNFDEVTEYNEANRIPYGHGSIAIINDFLDESTDILTNDFISAWQQDVDFIGSLPRFDYVELIETEETRAVTSVTDNSGTARFNHAGSGISGLVRVSESSIVEYEGDYRVVVNMSGYVELENVIYLGGATCTITELKWEDNDNDDQALLIHKPSVNLVDIGYSDTVYGPDGSDYSTVGLAYFYYPDNGTRFSRFRGVSLPFNAIEEGQKGIKDAYWGSAERILNNGVLVKYIAHLPEAVFYQLDFLRMVRVVTPEENLTYLVNRITGFKGSQFPCELELINVQNVLLETVLDQAADSVVTPDPEPDTGVTNVSITNDTSTGDVTVDDITVSDSKTFTPTSGSFPIADAESMTGEINGIGIFALSIEISVNVAAHKITVTDSNGTAQCQDIDSPGTYLFSGVVCDSATVTILIEEGGC